MKHQPGVSRGASRATGDVHPSGASWGSHFPTVATDEAAPNDHRPPVCRHGKGHDALLGPGTFTGWETVGQTPPSTQDPVQIGGERCPQGAAFVNTPHEDERAERSRPQPYFRATTGQPMFYQQQNTVNCQGIDSKGNRTKTKKQTTENLMNTVNNAKTIPSERPSSRQEAAFGAGVAAADEAPFRAPKRTDTSKDKALSLPNSGTKVSLAASRRGPSRENPSSTTRPPLANDTLAMEFPSSAKVIRENFLLDNDRRGMKTGNQLTPHNIRWSAIPSSTQQDTSNKAPHELRQESQLLPHELQVAAKLASSTPMLRSDDLVASAADEVECRSEANRDISSKQIGASNDPFCTKQGTVVGGLFLNDIDSSAMEETITQSDGSSLSDETSESTGYQAPAEFLGKDINLSADIAGLKRTGPDPSSRSKQMSGGAESTRTFKQIEIVPSNARRQLSASPKLNNKTEPSDSLENQLILGPNISNGIPRNREQASIGAASAAADHRVERPMSKECILYPLSLCLALVMVLVLLFLCWPSKPSPVFARQSINVLKRRSDGTCASVKCMENTVYLSNLVSWGHHDPCQSFYAFVCHRWTTQFPSPSKDSVTVDDDYSGFLEKKLRLSLQGSSQDSKVLWPVKNLYDKCDTFGAIDDSGWDALLELMSEVTLEGFPLNAPARVNLSVWKMAAKVFRVTGAAALLSVGVASHPSLAAKDIASVGPPELLTTHGGVDTKRAVHLYTTAVFGITRDLNIRNFTPAIAFAMVNFAREIEELGQLKLRRNVAKINRLPTPSPLVEFLEEGLRGLELTLFSNASSEVLIRSPDFVDDIVDMVAREDAQIVADYLGLRLMIQVAPFTPNSALTDIYSTLLYGKPQTGLPRWKLCVRTVEKVLYPLVYAHLFADLNVKAVMPTLTNFMRGVVEAFKTEMDNLPYFGRSSSVAVKYSLYKASIKLFGPVWTRDDALVQGYIGTLPAAYATQPAIKNYLWYYQNTFLHGLQRGSGMRWTRSTFTTDCWSEPHPRTLHVPLLAFNVTQVLESGVADAMQLSRLAPRMARCLFDMIMDEASSVNVGGSFLDENVWSGFLRAEECFGARQDYMRFSRLRDVVAARVSYRLFAKSVDMDEKIAPPSGNAGNMKGPLVAAQLFFISLMLQNCQTGIDPYWMKRSFGGDDWVVALRHMTEFSSAFNCSPQSVMNPGFECVSRRKQFY